MTRSDSPDAPVCLIDLAEVRAAHWTEEAVFLERQLWSRPKRLKATKPVRALRRARKACGLTAGEDDDRIAMVRRILLAASAPCFLRTEGNPRHLAACLAWIERGLAGV